MQRGMRQLTRGLQKLRKYLDEVALNERKSDAAHLLEQQPRGLDLAVCGFRGRQMIEEQRRPGGDLGLLFAAYLHGILAFRDEHQMNGGLGDGSGLVIGKGHQLVALEACHFSVDVVVDGYLKILNFVNYQ